MGKVLTLLFLTLLTLGSLIGYLFLTDKITSRSQKIAAGQKQLEQGEQMLANGKARLASGKQQLSHAKNTYNKIKPVIWAAAVLPVTEGVLVFASNKIAKKKITEGEQLVAQGQGKIKAGERQLKEGKLELSRGMKQLNLANRIRLACAIGTVFFASLLIALGFYWRRSLSKILKYPKT